MPSAETWKSRTGKDDFQESDGSLALEDLVGPCATRARGMTINLGDFESARFDVGVTLYGDDVDALDKIAGRIATDFAAYEAANVRGKQGERVRVPDLEGCRAVVLRIHFGLTLNTGNYENVKTDVGRSVVCHPDDLGDVWEDTRDYLRGEVKSEVKDIRGL